MENDKEVNAELDIKKGEIKPEADVEKTALQTEIAELRKKNQDLEAVAGRVPALNSRLDTLENTLDEKINSMLNTKQTTPATEESVVLDDEDYVTGKRTKQLIDDAVKANSENQEAIVKKVLVDERGQKTQYDSDYLKEVARLSMDIGEDVTLQGILSEMDTNFRDDSIKDPKVQAKVNYSGAKASYVTKAMSAGQQVTFGRKDTPVASLAVGHRGAEKPVQKEEVVVEPKSQDAKDLLVALEPDSEKRKALAKEALA